MSSNSCGTRIGQPIGAIGVLWSRKVAPRLRDVKQNLSMALALPAIVTAQALRY
jgi:hypothetical protein